ncbi:MBOAT family O-acyltransferase [Phaeodactylibacter xiamenensis]|uniref:MBOAT family O-acyltransferase n=1 Tax=Phaeodactylibacter xiamenensis TaxID=1524460 RepID=UPI0024A7BBDB|nr:MBOAT family O-acyltransferase [Phaeodactylibacter xiamenensis]
MAWRWEYAFLMLGVSVINYYGGQKIAQLSDKAQQKRWLLLIVTASLLPLAYFKYANFFLDSVNNLFVLSSGESYFNSLNIILPVGISFFTFQALSYSIDVYRGHTQPEKRIVNFLAFVSFFPQLIAGPIERSDHLLQQFKEKHRLQLDAIIQGGKIFFWGLFKKIVIADRLSLLVDRVYATPDLFDWPTLLVATLFFAVQIYCDFSGYSDMAIGIARMLGFRLMQNFNLPYLSRSIGEFWSRWHISLSTWFRDYMYIPLGGNRVPESRWMFNIMLVFLVSGLWHGANWTFIVWGGLHGFYYLLESWGDKALKIFKAEGIKSWKVYDFAKWLIVFLMVLLAWVYFRAASLSDANLIVYKILTLEGNRFYFGASTLTFVLSLGLILLLFCVQILQYYKIAALYFRPSSFPIYIRWSAYIAMLIGICLFGMGSNAFIYFQF